MFGNEFCSEFIEGYAYFGGYPTQEQVDWLESNGVRHFVSLVCPYENLIPYNHSGILYSFPIVDRKYPSDVYQFSGFIVLLCTIIKSLKQGEKMYVHCKGGHGRSGIVVSSILSHLYNISPRRAMELTNIYHNNRTVMKQKWRDVGSPQLYYQKLFVEKLFKPMYFTRATTTGPLQGFSLTSNHSVHLPGVGEFITADACFQAHRNLLDKSYVVPLLQTTDCYFPKRHGESIKKTVPEWHIEKDNIMKYILHLKFSQHKYLMKNLVCNTGLRPIIYRTKIDHYWGDGGDGSGKNMLGKLLSDMRNDNLLSVL